MNPGPADGRPVRPDNIRPDGWRLAAVTSGQLVAGWARPGRVAWLVMLAMLASAAHLWADDSLYKFGSFPKGLSTYAGEIDALHDTIFVITGLVFLVTEGLLLFFMWHYRERPGHKATYTHGHMGLEVAWTLFPIVVFVFLGIYSIRLWNRIKDPSYFPTENVFEVRVVAQQFEWHIFYPGPDGKLGTKDDIEVTNELQVPINRPVLVHLTSKDVIHSFFLPEMRLKQDAVPGMEVKVWFQPTDFANLEIACAELCGLGHYRMRGILKVVHPDALTKWLKEQEE